MSMLINFDKAILEDDEFKEDSVREEIIAPILKELGYASSGTCKIIRSRGLKHPFVSIGSKRTKIEIIPDYLLEIDGRPRVVVDAKAPWESIRKSKHVEQAYSYAIHPEVRADIYSLCNGKEWILWEISRFDPILELTIDDLVADISRLKSYLSPESVNFPQKRDFLPDFGLSTLKIKALNSDTTFLAPAYIGNILKVEDSLYTVIGSVDLGESVYSISYDLNDKAYESLLEIMPVRTREYVTNMLKRQPFMVDSFDEVLVRIVGHFGELTRGQFEDFVPVIVDEIKKEDSVNYDDQ